MAPIEGMIYNTPEANAIYNQHNQTKTDFWHNSDGSLGNNLIIAENTDQIAKNDTAHNP